MSSASRSLARSGGSAPRLAAAASETSGPGCRPSSRNSRAASAVSARYDHEKTDLTSVAVSPARKGSRARDAPRSSPAMTASGSAGAVAARAAATVSASGNRAHRSMMSDTAAGSRVTRVVPRRRVSSSRASAGDSRSSVSGLAPSVATSPTSRLRLVTMATQPGEPGSSGRTCSGVPRVVQHDEHPLAREHAAVEPGLAAEVRGNPRFRDPERLEEAAQRVARLERGPAGSNPRRFAKSWPSGNRADDPPRPVHGERRLADAGRAGQHRDGDAPPRFALGASARRRQQRVQAGQLGAPAGEGGHRRQLRRDGRLRAARLAGPGRRPRSGRAPDPAGGWRPPDRAATGWGRRRAASASARRIRW